MFIIKLSMQLNVHIHMHMIIVLLTSLKVSPLYTLTSTTSAFRDVQARLPVDGSSG